MKLADVQLTSQLEGDIYCISVYQQPLENSRGSGGGGTLQ